MAEADFVPVYDGDLSIKSKTYPEDGLVRSAPNESLT